MNMSGFIYRVQVTSRQLVTNTTNLTGVLWIKVDVKRVIKLIELNA